MDMIDCIILNVFWDIWCILKVFRPARPRNLRKWWDTQKQKQTSSQHMKEPTTVSNQIYYDFSLHNRFSSHFFFSHLKYHSPTKTYPSPFTSSQLQAGCHRGGSGTHEFLERTSRRRWNGRIDGSTGRIFRWFFFYFGKE